MYAFRKPFSVATFQEAPILGLDFKIVLVIAQISGYALSKFIGIRFISGFGFKHRAIFILLFIGLAELALLGYALVPVKFKFLMMF